MSPRPSVTSRKPSGALGMNAPSVAYDAGTVGQMQVAIMDLAAQLDALKRLIPAPSEPQSVVQQQQVKAPDAAPSVVDGVEPGQVTPSPVSASPGAVGNDERYARATHRHQGQPWQDLTLSAPEGGYVNGTLGHSGDYGYYRLNGVWRCLTHVE